MQWQSLPFCSLIDAMHNLQPIWIGCRFADIYHLCFGLASCMSLLIMKKNHCLPNSPVTLLHLYLKLQHAELKCALKLPWTILYFIVYLLYYIVYFILYMYLRCKFKHCNALPIVPPHENSSSRMTMIQHSAAMPEEHTFEKDKKNCATLSNLNIEELKLTSAKYAKICSKICTHQAWGIKICRLSIAAHLMSFSLRLEICRHAQLQMYRHARACQPDMPTCLVADVERHTQPIAKQASNIKVWKTAV